MRSFARPMAWLMVAAGLAQGATAFAQSATPWTEGYNSKTRLLAGQVPFGAERRAVVGVEIALAPGWKTYWRAPGDSGGVPPIFDLSQSKNLASATVHYPAPHRMVDVAGEAVGYKGGVIFPIEVVAADRAKPIALEVVIEYGICREICVPAEARMSLVLDPASLAAAPAAITAALETVPRAAGKRRPTDPELKAVTAVLAGDKPRIEIEAVFPGSGEGADVFVEASEGIYLPLPRRIGAGAGPVLRFEIDLATGVEPAELKGKTLTFTLVSAAGQSEAARTID
jgi:DsbC/DsbD-like thiol-disulfide interchange protein